MTMISASPLDLVRTMTMMMMIWICRLMAVKGATINHMKGTWAEGPQARIMPTWSCNRRRKRSPPLALISLRELVLRALP